MSLRARPRRRLLPVAALSLVVLAATPAAEPGLVYDFTMQTTSTTDGKSRELQRIAGRGQVAGDRARVDVTEVKTASPLAEEGGHVIVDGGGQRMIMVNPREKGHFAFEPEEMMKGMGAMMKTMGPLMKMSMSDARVDVPEVGAGPSMHGYDTRHFRLVQSYTMTIRAMGFGGTSTANDTIDYWMAPKLKSAIHPYAKMAGAGTGMDFGNPDYARQMQAANAKLSVGVPLRTEMRGTSVDEKGKVTRNLSVMEVTSLRPGDVPSSVFEIPAGYTEQPSPFDAMASSDSLEAARARGAAGAEGDSSTAAKEEPKASAKDAAKKAVRGIFRRP